VLDRTWNRRKAAALLKLLALQHELRMHREVVLDRLWPNLDPTAAANNLYKSLYYLRHAFAEAGVEDPIAAVRSDVVTLSPSVWVDVVGFRSLAAQAKSIATEPSLYEQALTLYGGELLPEDSYEDWAEPQREQFRSLQVQLLFELGLLYEARGRTEDAIERLCQLVQVDPLHEEAHRALMQLFAGIGSRHQAIRQYHVCRAVLQRELDVQPSEETEALYRRIVAGRTPAVVPDTAVIQKDRMRAIGGDRTVLGQISKVLQSPPNNLPLPLTRFIGREHERSEVKRLLCSSRLVTLTGAGGCGKTRLALQVASELLGRYEDGTSLVELASLTDAALVPQIVASGLGLREPVDRRSLEVLCEHLEPRHTLLVLDNCAHLIDACAQLVQTLLQCCRFLQVLATSREALGIGGEAIWRVASLSLPYDVGIGYRVSGVAAGDGTPETRYPTPVAQSEAVQLFVERARASLPGFVLTDENTAAVVQICRRLDGIPLALELAAARLPVLPVQQIAARLDDRFRLLVAGSRTAVPRQQTLRATVEWSYELLQPAERLLFNRLSVFAGGFDLQALEGVCAWGDLQGKDLLTLLARLAGKSLVVADDERGQARYRLLETLLQYGWERVQASGEEAALREQHGERYRALVEAQGSRVLGGEQRAWLRRLEDEHDNLRAALGWYGEQGRAEPMLRLAGALRDFWELQGHLSEGRAWLARALSLDAPILPGTARIGALCSAAFLAMIQNDLEEACNLCKESLALSEQLNDAHGIATSLYMLALAELRAEDDDAAAAHLQESLRRCRENEDQHGIAVALRPLGKLAQRRGDPAGALEALAESLRIERALDNAVSIAVLSCDLGELACANGDYGLARRFYCESLTIGKEMGSSRYTAMALESLAQLTALEGEPARSAQQFGAAAALRSAIGAPLAAAAHLERERSL
ncbi:MAG: ATP-binding protein, partial [Dehalococcoidia bacterium]